MSKLINFKHPEQLIWSPERASIRFHSQILYGLDALNWIDFGTYGQIGIVCDRNVADLPVVARLGQLVNATEVVLTGGRPGPRAALELAKRIAGIELILVVGGGSTFDLARGAVVMNLTNSSAPRAPGRWIDGLTREQIGERPTMIAVPTIPGAGADHSRYFVLYDDSTGEKIYGRSWGLVFDATLILPEVARTLEIDLVLEASFDCAMHHFEVLANVAEGNDWLRALAGASNGALHDALSTFLSGEFDVSAATRMFETSSFGGLLISNCRTGLIHELAGPFAEVFGISHGVSLLLIADVLAQRTPESGGLYTDGFLDSLAGKSWGRTFSEYVARWWELLERRILAELVSVTETPSGRIKREAQVHELVTKRVGMDHVLQQKMLAAPIPAQHLRELTDSVLRRIGEFS